VVAAGLDDQVPSDRDQPAVEGVLAVGIKAPDPSAHVAVHVLQNILRLDQAAQVRRKVRDHVSQQVWTVAMEQSFQCAFVARNCPVDQR
jgi:hypothetical protein